MRGMSDQMDEPLDFDGPDFPGDGNGRSSGGEKEIAKTFLFLVLLVFGVIVLPAAVLAWLFLWLMLHRLKQKPRVSAVVVALAVGASALAWRWTDAGQRFMDFFSHFNLDTVRDDWMELLPAYIVAAVVLGFVFGQFAIMREAYRIKTEPHLTRLQGSWQYNFAYRRSPVQLITRRMKIKKLKRGECGDDERAPLGIDESDNRSDIAYRYEGEATRHTLLSGTVGSGKALHEDTPIPTPEGMKTVGVLQPGSRIFGSSGEIVRIADKFQPMTEDHYVLSLPGVSVRACGDHLWPAVIDGAEGVYDTRSIYDAFQEGKSVTFSTVGREVEFDPVPEPHIDCSDVVFMIQDEDATSVNNYMESILYGSLRVRREFADAVFAGMMLHRVLHVPEGVDDGMLREILASLGYHTYVSGYDGGYVKISFHSGGSLPLVRIEEIDDTPESYFCFTVDSEDRLFAATPFFLKTHNTITMLSLVRADMEAGRSVVFIDFKRAPEVAGKLSSWSEELGMDFYHFTEGSPEDYNVKGSKGQCVYDPLSNPSPGFRADMLLGMREWDTASEVYRTNMQQVLQVLVNGLANVDRNSSDAEGLDFEHGGLFEIASAIANTNLHKVADACPDGSQIRMDVESLAKEVYSRGRGAALGNAVAELRGQLQTLIASTYGRWFKVTPGSRNIDLFKLTSTPGNVVLFSISADEQPDFAKHLGSMIFSDLRAVSARKLAAGNKDFVSVYADEFQSVPPTAVTSMLEKSRESGMGLTLGMQSFDQIVSASPAIGEAMLSKIIDTCGNFIIHAGSAQDSAERLSKIMGTVKGQKLSTNRRSDSWIGGINFWNRRKRIESTQESVEWKFDPQNFMNLTLPSDKNGYKSTAVLINKMSLDPKFEDTKGAVAREVWVIPNDAVLGSYFEPRLDVSDQELMDESMRTIEDVITSDDISDSVVQGGHDYVVDSEPPSMIPPPDERDPEDGYDPDDDGDFQWEESSEVDNLDSMLEGEISIDTSSEPPSKNRFDDLGRFAPPPARRQEKREQTSSLARKSRSVPMSKEREDDALPDLDGLL